MTTISAAIFQVYTMLVGYHLKGMEQISIDQIFNSVNVLHV